MTDRVISIPERGTVELAFQQWSILSADLRFWCLVRDNIVSVEARRGGHWRLRAGCYVGRAIIGNTILEVVEGYQGAFELLLTLSSGSVPKVSPARSPVTPGSNSIAIVIELFLRAVRAYLSGNKKIAYIDHQESGALIAGRLNVPKTIHKRARGMVHHAVFVRASLTCDMLFNRCVYAALGEVERLARTVRLSTDTLVAARMLRVGLSDCFPAVLRTPRRELAAAAAREAASGRLNALEQEVISFAGAVLDGAGFGKTEKWNATVERAWFVNLENYFERALRNEVGRVLAPHAIATGPGRRPSLFVPDVNRYRSNPDIVIKNHTENVIAIADAKYKDSADWPPVSDVHEIVAHAAPFRAPIAMLFYVNESGFSSRSLGLAATGTRLWSFGISFQNFRSDVERGLFIAGLLQTENVSGDS